MNTNENNNYEKYISLAHQMGAADAKFFTTGEIVFDPRTILKCKYGCEDYGLLHTCPSNPKSLGIEESIRIFKHYKDGVLIHCHDKFLSQKISMEIERKAFLDGFYFAFSLSDCAICPECKGVSGKPCANPRQARPALHSIGVDVFATARHFGLPIETLKSKEETQNWYSAVFIK